MKYCAHCGKEIADEAVICLNCGCSTKNTNGFVPPQVVQTQNQVIVEDSEPQLATWSKICGIVSFFIGWFALGITAIVLACMSKDETNGIMCPSAKTGFVCGIVSTVLSLVLFVLFIMLVTILSI